ncbi:hypothetical protein [Streptomyces sp. NPDC088141]|uniref:hypothetical protein n=1 Tax=Streptomyces sp. NPDC088141 TaxID=3155179 RepID=UPI00344043A2
MPLQVEERIRFSTTRPWAPHDDGVVGAYLAQLIGTFTLVFAITATATSAGLVGRVQATIQSSVSTGGVRAAA